MQDNKNNSKKKSGSGFVAVIIIAAVYAFQWIIEEVGGRGLFILLVLGLIIALIAVTIYLVAAKKKREKSGTWQARTPFSFTRQQINISDSRPARDMRSECSYGSVNHKYSHDLERRITQLDGFLKNGIISKEEYTVLLDRYKKSASIEL